MDESSEGSSPVNSESSGGFLDSDDEPDEDAGRRDEERNGDMTRAHCRTRDWARVQEAVIALGSNVSDLDGGTPAKSSTATSANLKVVFDVEYRAPD